jgi:putative endonuclease
MFYIYLLRCKNNSLYCGYTRDLHKRVHSHLYTKMGAKYTKIFTPLSIACAFCLKADLSFALKIEYAIKQLSKEKKEALVSGADLMDIIQGVQAQSDWVISRMGDDELAIIWKSCHEKGFITKKE